MNIVRSIQTNLLLVRYIYRMCKYWQAGGHCRFEKNPAKILDKPNRLATIPFRIDLTHKKGEKQSI